MGRALDIADRLAHARALAGLSQAALAKASGVSPGEIGLYESRKRTARIDKVHTLAEALAVDAGWLATGEGEPHPPATRSDLERIEAKLDEVLRRLDETDRIREDAVGDIEGIAGEPQVGK